MARALCASLPRQIFSSYASRLNPHSGKWNFHFGDKTAEINARPEAEFDRELTRVMAYFVPAAPVAPKHAAPIPRKETPVEEVPHSRTRTYHN